MSKESLHNTIDEVSKATKTLQNLREYSFHIQNDDVSSAGNARLLASHLQQVQTRTRSLSRAIANAVRLECHSDHAIGVALEPRIDDLYSRHHRIDFNIIILAQANQTRLTLHPRLIHVRSLDHEEHIKDTKPNQLQVQSDSIGRSSNATKRSDLGYIDSLCRSLDDSGRAKGNLDVFLCHDSKFICYGPSDSCGTDFFSTSSDQIIASVDDILNPPTRDELSFKPWTLMQRMTLSIRLASSLLQLCCTPWLLTGFSKGRICFFCTTSSADTIRVIDADHPFITYSTQQSRNGMHASEATIKRQTLELGILLLELWHGISYEAWAAKTQATPGSCYGTRYENAMSWLKRTQHEIPSFYRCPTIRCIECAFPTASCFQGWDDQILQKAICETVILPLHEAILGNESKT